MFRLATRACSPSLVVLRAPAKPAPFALFLFGRQPEAAAPPPERPAAWERGA